MLAASHSTSPSPVANVAPRRGSRVPAEYTGLARLLRNRVEAADRAVQPVLMAIARPLRARLTRHPLLRADQIVDAEREWRRRMPGEFRIGDVVVQRSRDSFSISEVRLVAHKIRLPSWEEDEPGVALYRCGWRLVAGRLMPSAVWVTTCIGLHAMGRRFERSECRTDDAVVADLALLAGPDVDALRVSGWVAETVIAENVVGDRYRLRSVRTWISGTVGNA